MTTSKIVPSLNKVLEKIVAPYASNINPNVVSMVGMIFPVITVLLIVNHHYAFAALSMFLFLFDKLDGVIARASGRASQWGGLLDATLDRITDSSVYIALGISGSASWVLCCSAMLVGFLVSYSKAKAEAGIGIKNIGSNQLSVGLMERTERLVIIGLAIFLFQFIPNISILGLNIIDATLVLSIMLTAYTFLIRMRKAYVLLTDNA